MTVRPLLAETAVAAAMETGLVLKAAAFRVKYRVSQENTIADPNGSAPKEPRRNVPATRHGAHLGLAHHGQGLQPEGGQPRRGLCAIDALLRARQA